jgi:hypothetical protein
MPPAACRASCCGLAGLSMAANTCQTALTGLAFEHAAANSFLAAQRACASAPAHETCQA